MRVRSKAILASTAIIAAVALSACSQIGNLQARKAFKDANTMPIRRRIIVEAATTIPGGHCGSRAASDPKAVTPISSSGNSYDNLYKPARKGEADNDALLTKAIENYKTRPAEKETDPKMKKLALDYLVGGVRPGQARRSDASRAASCSA